MSLNIVGQYKDIIKEQEKLKRMVKRVDRNFVVFEKYMNHVKRVEKARGEIKKKKLIPQEKLFRELGF